MSTTYATLSQLKTLLGESGTDHDTLLQLYLDSAAEWIDLRCRSTFVSGNATLEEYDGTGTRAILLRNRPVRSISEVRLDGSAIESTSYELSEAAYLVTPKGRSDFDNPRLWRGEDACDQFWPVGTNNVAVSYAYGYAAVPVSIQSATLMLARHWWDQEQRRGVSSESFGPRSVVYGQLGEAQLEAPPRVLALISPFIQPLVLG